MIDRALGLGLVQQQSYYFQLIPLYLSIVGKDSELPAHGTTYKFSVWKGQQKFDENKFPIQANFKEVEGVQVMSVASCKLNFYLPSFNKLRKQQFTLRLIQNEQNHDYDIGEYTVNVSELVQAFKKQNKIRYELKTFFSEDYELDFEIYIEKTRPALERAIKDSRGERISKSPVKARPSIDNTPSKPTQSQIPQKDVEQQKNNEENKNIKADIEITNRQQIVEKQKINSNPAPQKQESIKNQSVKNESMKQSQKVPFVQTKFKQLAKQDAPAQTKMQQSRRMSNLDASSEKLSQASDSGKQKIFMWMFLLVGLVIMYSAMHPNKRV